jgi:hypothetical protein
MVHSECFSTTVSPACIPQGDHSFKNTQHCTRKTASKTIFWHFFVWVLLCLLKMIDNTDSRLADSNTEHCNSKHCAGETELEKLLQLPPEVTLPPLHYLSKRPGWSGRNSDKSLCKEISVPPKESAVSVDDLLANVSKVRLDCGELPCREVWQVAQGTTTVLEGLP